MTHKNHAEIAYANRLVNVWRDRVRRNKDELKDSKKKLRLAKKELRDQRRK